MDGLACIRCLVLFQVNLPQTIGSIANPYADCSELGIHDAMTCQELLAFSVAFSAALPTGQSTLESFYSSLARCDPHTVEALKRATAAAAAATVANDAAADAAAASGIMGATETANAPQPSSTTGLELAAVSAAVPMTQHAETQQRSSQGTRKDTHRNHSYNNNNNNNNNSQSRNNNGQRSNALQHHRSHHAAAPTTGNYMEDYACCYDLYQNALSPLDDRRRPRSPALRLIIAIYRCMMRVCSFIRRYIKRLVEHKYFQQGILLAILINTLSMGIEYHDQPEELTAIVETSNVVFSGIFAVEMLLKVVAEGPFRYIANGFNVFDGIIVILRYG